MKRSSIIVAAALLSVVGSLAQLGVVATAVAISVASATATSATPARTVRYDDLNLTAPAGIALLYGRIQAAADATCGEARPVGTHIVSPTWRACTASAVDGAVRQLDLPALTAYHAAHTEGRN